MVAPGNHNFYRFGTGKQRPITSLLPVCGGFVLYFGALGNLEGRSITPLVDVVNND